VSFPYLLRSQDWIRTATLAATSERTGYPVENVATDEPSEPWGGASGTEEITITFGGPREVGVIALIMNTADDGRPIAIGGFGSPAPTLVGRRSASGYPMDIAVVLDTPQTVSSLTIGIAGNSVPWSIGRIVVMPATALDQSFLLEGFTLTPSRPQESDENHVGHDLRYDYGIERWRADGVLLLETVAQRETIDEWWQSTRGGFYPTLIVVGDDIGPPIWGRLQMTLPRTLDVPAGVVTRIPITIADLARGLEPVP